MGEPTWGALGAFAWARTEGPEVAGAGKMDGVSTGEKDGDNAGEKNGFSGREQDDDSGRERDIVTARKAISNKPRFFIN